MASRIRERCNRRNYQLVNIVNDLSEEDAIIVLRHSHVRSKCSKLLLFLLLFFLLASIAISVWLGVTLSGHSKSSAEQSGECSAATYQFDCYPEGGANETSCASRGCCWNSSVSPSCFYPDGFGYSMDGALSSESYGHSSATLKRKANQPVQYGGPVATLRVDVYQETHYRLRVKISDPSTNRYEVPWPPRPITSNVSNTQYKVTTGSETFNFTVSREDTGLPIFSTATGFIFEDQFLQISALLPYPNIYGLGEHTTRLRLPTNITLTMFSHDTPPLPSKPTQNLYGVHPFYLGLEQDGRAHGVFLLNSNAMEIQLQPYPSITYRTIGGVLDFYFFLGPGPDQVIQQYTELIGRPFLPPYWSLGFHLSRWGYMTANNTLAVVKRMRQKGIPQDTQWNDIDYMDMDLDFTYSTSFGDLPGLVSNLHDHSQKYVLIVDPAISNQQPTGQYPPFDSGFHNNVFITKNSSGQLLIGKVWPNSTTVWPDFTHPNVDQYWTGQISQFHSIVQFDGLWIDMNEPSNFVDGSMDGCPTSSLESPSFVPKAIRTTIGQKLASGTLCMTANQYLSTHYNLHSLYGLTEANVTMNALMATLNKRSLVISRSTYPGSGAHGGHWLGDNTSEWPDLAISIPGILQFSLFGIPLVGADICGFNGNTTQELCTRWHQLGAFYPFSRNHNSLDSIDQDPAVFDDASVDSIRNALLLRYQLLPYLYTLFYFTHTNGSTVARPLFFEFPTDNNTWDLDTQFMWGSSLLISPVLKENATSVEAYFPRGSWFNFDGSKLTSAGQLVVLDVPYDSIPFHVRGGSVVPLQTPNTTTTQSRMNSFQLLIAPDDNQTASGYLYLDDGESLNTEQNNKYTLLQFTFNMNTFTSSVISSGYSGADNAFLESVKVYGLQHKPTHFLLNGTSLDGANVNYNNEVLTLDVELTGLNEPFSIGWN